jgi:IS30 family transposase
MSNYSQLSLEERCSIARLREAGQSIRQIAAALDRQPSTVSRELRRNSGSKVGYQPGYAQAQAGARRWHGARLEREEALREVILDRLGEGWSPEQIAGRLLCPAETNQ